MNTQLTEQESLDIENGLLRDMARRYARLIEINKERADMANVETVRIMMTRDGPLSHQRKGLILDARVGVGRDDKPVYWIHWAGNSLAVDASECVRLNGGGTPK